jgi:hypothetical protein
MLYVLIQSLALGSTKGLDGIKPHFQIGFKRFLNLKRCVKIGTIGFKNLKFQPTPPFRESLEKSNVSKLDQWFSLKRKLANSSLDL